MLLLVLQLCSIVHSLKDLYLLIHYHYVFTSHCGVPSICLLAAKSLLLLPDWYVVIACSLSSALWEIALRKQIAINK